MNFTAEQSALPSHARRLALVAAIGWLGLAACATPSASDGVETTEAPLIADTRSITANPDGTFDVVCKDNSTAHGVTATQIAANQLCNAPPTRTPSPPAGPPSAGAGIDWRLFECPGTTLLPRALEINLNYYRRAGINVANGSGFQAYESLDTPRNTRRFVRNTHDGAGGWIVKGVHIDVLDATVRLDANEAKLTIVSGASTEIRTCTLVAR